ncbi:SprB repeat-containing protein, partial [Flavobacterium hydrophilum]
TDIAFAVTTAPVCPSNVADITLTVSGGYVPMAKYEIISPITVDNGNNSLFTGLAPNTYLFKVTDANGCSIEENYTVDPVTRIAISGALLTDISCNAADGTTNNGSAQFTVTGFSATGNYSVVTSPVVAAAQLSQAGDVITLTGLSAGTYTVTVQDNTTHCSESAAVTITEPNAIDFDAIGTKVFCSQDVSSITVSAVTGGTGSYTYAVVQGGSSAPIASAYGTNAVMSVDTNLTNLSWDVYVKDSNGCIHMENVTITNNAAPSITAAAAQCYVGSALTVDLDLLTTTYNGVKSYTVNGSAIATSTATFTAPGTYTLGIKDDNGCEAFVSYTIEKQLLATATLTKDLYCAGSVNATIDVVITDGVGPYTYQMYVGGVATGPATATAAGFTASVSAAGSYTFVITDSNAAVCSVTTNAAVVTTPATPVAFAVPTAVICNGESNGTIAVTPSNGVAPYTFVLSGTGANTSGDATGVYTGLVAGTTYSVVVTDAKGCASLAVPVTITEPVLLAATASVTPFGCNSGNVAQPAVVTVTATSGTGT